MDATHSVTKEQGRSSAVVTLGLSLVLTVALGRAILHMVDSAEYEAGHAGWATSDDPAARAWLNEELRAV